jgi:hypothetical protein
MSEMEAIASLLSGFDAGEILLLKTIGKSCPLDFTQRVAEAVKADGFT